MEGPWKGEIRGRTAHLLVEELLAARALVYEVGRWRP